MELCEECGFDFDMVSRDDITRRVMAGVREAADVVASAPSISLHRPTVDRWSAVEYTAHMRDVLLTIRDRLVIGLVEDNPCGWADRPFTRSSITSATSTRI